MVVLVEGMVSVCLLLLSSMFMLGHEDPAGNNNSIGNSSSFQQASSSISITPLFRSEECASFSIISHYQEPKLATVQFAYILEGFTLDTGKGPQFSILTFSLEPEESYAIEFCTPLGIANNPVILQVLVEL